MRKTIIQNARKPSYISGGFLAFSTKIWYESRRIVPVHMLQKMQETGT
jgi:hypothetical protein